MEHSNKHAYLASAHVGPELRADLKVAGVGAREMAERVDKSIGCSSRGPGRFPTPTQELMTVFITPIPGILVPSSGLFGYCTHVVYTHSFRQTCIYIK